MPLISIGPSWPFTIGLLTFAFGAAGYFSFLLTIFQMISYSMKVGGALLLALSILILLIGILKNPGIP